MRGTRSATVYATTLSAFGFCLAFGQWSGSARAGDEGAKAKADPIAVGYEIFNREWMPNDPRGHGGDGLGPVYNDTSCVACHNAGGGGGGGPNSKNIDVLSASRLVEGMMVPMVAGAAPAKPDSAAVSTVDALIDFHAGFKAGRTVVLHKFGSDPNYNDWRARAVQRLLNQVVAPGVLPLQSLSPLPSVRVVETSALLLSSLVPTEQAAEPKAARADEQLQRIRAAVRAASASSRQSTVVGAFKVSGSQRNPTALFGLGQLDAISEQDIDAAARKQALKTPEVQGRISRLKDGRIGRLGWKGQTANVEDFVLNACAVEIGLEVPGHSQASSPQAPKYRATGLDLTSGECSALVAYVRSLPRPIERKASGLAEAKHIAAGKAAFAGAGCASCHTPKLGDVAGLYSDLLLHDMGDDTADDGSYSDGFDDGDDPFGPESAPIAANTPKPASRVRGASQREWRTPPLWGFRDSGPYLHDGRAQSLDEAVALHGGQGEAAAKAFFTLSPRERLQVEAFLKSLTAPAPVALVQRGE